MVNCVIRQTHVMVVVLGLHILFGSPAGCCPVTSLSRPEETSVTLNTGYKSTAATDIHLVEWYYNERELIMRYYPGSKSVIQPAYEGRVKFDDNAFSLELMNIKRNDSGLYHCKITEEKPFCAGFSLSVFESISEKKVTSTAQITSPASLLILTAVVLGCFPIKK
ncbi:hypothetical protein AALO_G00226060 [Alosa alosa]|uniref:Ig-like domain-containing protein n=1 Tax=Alosa alosa TaxID=278164 RepID=A0AAV6FY84_9TELE|nr:SLAM family member 9-like [Alosa alosa]KAG5267813.1 hypothetical protein AALO_G00226060 [Alosa alosa]